MRSYRVINDYKRINKVTVKDLKSNLYYLIWVRDDYSAIYFNCNPSSLRGTGYMRLFEEVCVFEEDDIIPYIYE